MAVKNAEYRSLPETEKRLYRSRRPTRAAGAAASKAEKLGVPLTRLVYARTLQDIQLLCEELGVNLDQRVARQRRNRGDGVRRFGEIVGYVSYVPKQTESVLVTYSDRAIGSGRGRSAVGELRVSAFVKPSTDQRASFRIYHRNEPKSFIMKRPRLMLTQTFSASRTLRMSGSGYSEVKIMEVVSAGSKIMVRPYRVANVYDDGKICTGSQNDRPKSLRSAWNLFWGAPFNTDLTSFGRLACVPNCPHKEHSYYGCRLQDRDAATHAHEHRRLCNCIEPRPNEPICVACSRVSRHGLPSHTVDLRDICMCCMGLDDCCQCPCRCCSGNCSCRCDCDLTDPYIEAIKGYRSRGCSEDWTASLTRPKFFSATGDYDGVFVSSKKAMLELVGAEHQHTAFNRLVVFGLFKALDGNRIAVQFGKDKAYTLSRDEVAAFSETNNSGRREEVR